MAKAVFIQNPSSIYNDQPGKSYHFPSRYLGRVRQTIGDWVLIYEGRQGAFGYVAVQKIVDVVPDEQSSNHHYAILDPGSLLQFEQLVPRANYEGIAFEKVLRGDKGKPTSGGANVSAVRLLGEDEFAAILEYGCTPIHQPNTLPREGPIPAPLYSGFSEQPANYNGPELNPVREDLLVSRKYRDAAFARMVKDAYGARCAISGLSLRNGGGRPEVQAAHIRPVAVGGPDIVSNGLALSGTLHWMFDRGLISVAQDMRILVSHNKVSGDIVKRLIAPAQRLFLPQNPRSHPHPEFLRFHREEIFGQTG